MLVQSYLLTYLLTLLTYLLTLLTYFGLKVILWNNLQTTRWEIFLQGLVCLECYKILK